MEEFAKLFVSERLQTQICCVLDESSEGNPVITVQFKPAEMGVCSVQLGFSDDDRGWKLAQDGFDKMDLETIEKITGEAMREIGQFTGGIQ